MLNVYYTCDINNVTGNILLKFEEIDIEHPYLTPLNFYFKNSATGKSDWQGVFYNPGDWAGYPFGFHSVIEVYDRLQNLVFKWTWDPLIHGDFIYKYFNCWAIKNKGAFGIAIGTHNGTSGEWVEPIRNGLLEGLLIEPTCEIYEELVNNYKEVDGVSTMMGLITPDGGQTTFYEIGDGYVNSVRLDLTKNYVTDNGPQIKEKVIDSISIVELFIKESEKKQIKWLHLDVEGIDDELILKLGQTNITLPELIIYESLNLGEQKEQYLLSWLRDRGYKTKISGWNTLAVKLEI